MKFFILILLTSLTYHIQAQDIYRWTDANGVTHYSYKAPENVDASKVKKMNMNTQSSFIKSGTINNALNKNEQEQELDRITKTNCGIAQKNIKVLTAFTDIKQKDSDGKLKVLSKDQKSKQLSLANKQAALFCKNN
jgi:hypothetical protein